MFYKFTNAQLKQNTMRFLFSTLIIISIFSISAFAQSNVESEKAAPTKTNKEDVMLQKKDVQVEKVAKPVERIEVKDPNEANVSQHDAVITKDATIENPKLNNKSVAVEKKTTATKQNIEREVTGKPKN